MARRATALTQLGASGFTLPITTKDTNTKEKTNCLSFVSLVSMVVDQRLSCYVRANRLKGSEIVTGSAAVT